jgi:hypothetical protein
MNEPITAEECAKLLSLLPDGELESIDCFESASAYSYRCGCFAIRYYGSDDCRVKWCGMHAPS